MGTIYTSAACNIAASWVNDGTQGCFSISDPAARTPTFISLKPPKFKSPTQYQMGQARSYDDEIKRVPLNKRGWVVQERYLTRRQLSFSRRQAYWECRQLVASEEFPTGVPLSLPKSHLEYDGGTDIRRVWVGLVALYSRCGLTRKSDKLVALSGLASELQTIPQDQYLSGLWRNDLWQQLCWQTVDQLYENEKFGQTTIPDHVVPTWSWANGDGPVKYDDAYYDLHSPDFRRKHVPWIEVRKESSTKKLVLRSIAGWGCTQSQGFEVAKEGVLVRLIDKITTERFRPSNLMHVWICWDEFSGPLNVDLDPDRLSTMQKERNCNRLFLVVRKFKISRRDHYTRE
ncbi:hypothetical protein F4804DRAFT_323948 [Jackrogersella minutella]|nr:hypothetical protein F4804DRAFT_323948 [Jackrogersella minutella]